MRLILIDPLGRLAAHSLPQGVGNYGNVDVRYPANGVWTGVIFGDVAADGGTNGPVPWRVATQQFVPFGAASPASFVLAPGGRRTVTVTATTPALPGDSSGSIQVTSGHAVLGSTTTSIPVTLRTLVDVAHGGTFQGVLNGGNGRPNGEGQQDYYQFEVGPNVNNITANVTLANDAANPVGVYLISPDGDTLGYGDNSFNGTPKLAVTAYTLNPTAGMWTLIVDFAEPVVGNELSDPFTGNIALNAVSVHASGGPTSTQTHLAAGTPVTVPVTITNTGAAPEDFFLDPRLNAAQSLTLAPLDQATDLPLPLTGNPPEWLVPTETSGVSVSATATLPIMFDFGPNQGDPDLASAASGPGPLCAKTESGSYNPPGGSVATGVWYAFPDECGPYHGPAPTGTVSSTMIVHTKAFDPAVTSDTGDLWLQSINPGSTFSPIEIAPGHSATIDVTITPSGAAGTQVSGHLYVDDFVPGVPPYGQTSGDELAAIPYAYTIG